LIVITAAPLAAMALIWIDRSRRAGAMLLAVSMAGALLFGVYYHFLVSSSDNFAVVPRGGRGDLFRLTSVLLGATEATGYILAMRLWRMSMPAPGKKR
jgi:hypothetical protein